MRTPLNQVVHEPSENSLNWRLCKLHLPKIQPKPTTFTNATVSRIADACESRQRSQCVCVCVFVLISYLNNMVFTWNLPFMPLENGLCSVCEYGRKTCVDFANWCLNARIPKYVHIWQTLAHSKNSYTQDQWWGNLVQSILNGNEIFKYHCRTYRFYRTVPYVIWQYTFVSIISCFLSVQ